MESTMEHKCAKKGKVQGSPLANSLLPPQHHHRHHRHLEDAIPNRPPLGDLSSPEEVGELRSLKKRSGCQISGPPYKGMIPRPDSPPSSSGKRTAAPASSSWLAPHRTPWTFVESRPPITALSRPDPCKASLGPDICRAILRRPGPADVRAPLWPWQAPSGSAPAKRTFLRAHSFPRYMIKETF